MPLEYTINLLVCHIADTQRMNRCGREVKEEEEEEAGGTVLIPEKEMPGTACC